MPPTNDNKSLLNKYFSEMIQKIRLTKIKFPPPSAQTSSPQRVPHTRLVYQQTFFYGLSEVL